MKNLANKCHRLGLNAKMYLRRFFVIQHFSSYSDVGSPGVRYTESLSMFPENAGGMSPILVPGCPSSINMVFVSMNLPDCVT
jgi:hypothetical protein